MNLSITVNEASSCTTTGPATKQVRVFFVGVEDSGHVSGPFSVEDAVKVAANFALRSDVKKVEVEDVV